MHYNKSFLGIKFCKSFFFFIRQEIFYEQWSLNRSPRKWNLKLAQFCLYFFNGISKRFFSFKNFGYACNLRVLHSAEGLESCQICLLVLICKHWSNFRLPANWMNVVRSHSHNTLSPSTTKFYAALILLLCQPIIVHKMSVIKKGCWNTTAACSPSK